jgi:hypothetical protein
MRITRLTMVVLALLFVATAAFAQQQPSTMTISGVTYTKWLWGNLRNDGSLYNFTTVPGEGYGDNGQGTELELLVAAKPNRYLEVSGRIHSRFSQNFWTNFGGFGGYNPATDSNPHGCTGGDCGEWDPRSNQYVKLRGLTVRVTPGWKYMDAFTFGATDLGMFDPWTMGKIRYIDRDNLAVIMAQGQLAPGVRYDATRISLPRLWAGPLNDYSTGQFTSQDHAYGMQFRWAATPTLDVSFVGDMVSDLEIDAEDLERDDGRDLLASYENQVIGARFDFHPAGAYAVRGQFYHSELDPNVDLIAAMGANRWFGINGYNPIPRKDMSDNAYTLDVDLNDPFGVGLSLNAQLFNVGSDYISVLAARRESDVLLTEGHDGAFAFNGVANGRYSVFGGNPPVLGYAGWQGNAQQVATINVDNEFTDFDEPMAESVIGWKGITIVPRWQSGTFEVAGEFSYIDYNTNWQAWDRPTLNFLESPYPAYDTYTGVHANAAYAAFQDRETQIALVRGKYTADIGKGVDFFGKIKTIQETDKRINDERYLPYQAGDCPGGGAACAGNANFYSGSFTTSSYFSNPGVITGANGQTGYQWAPFDSLDDDDRDMDYVMLQVGAGYQMTDTLYGSLAYERYDVDLQDGNTAFQAYNLHDLASGDHSKNKVIALLKFPIGGAEAGFNYEYAFGEFDPEFGDGFVPVQISDQTAADLGLPKGSLGFYGRYGNFNSLETREFDHHHLKAYFKVRF